MNNEKQVPKAQNISDHLANERTFLAWIRTSIAVMAFGFVVEKFSVFLQKVMLFLRHDDPLAIASMATQPTTHYSYIFGLLLVIVGGIMCMLAFFKFKTTETQIDNNNYSPSLLLDVLLTLTIVLIGLFLVLYLVHNIFH